MLSYIPYFKQVHRPVIYAALLHMVEEVFLFSEIEEKQKNKRRKKRRTRSYQIRQTRYKKTRSREKEEKGEDILN
jgi:hypothetical protein